MNLACSEKELEQLLSDVAFTRNFGFVLQGIADGQCSINVPFQAAFERPGGIVSGQVFMAAADVAMWLAIKTKLGMTDSSVTAEMKTNFLGTAKREEFRRARLSMTKGKTSRVCSPSEQDLAGLQVYFCAAMNGALRARFESNL